jgi:hypothetical protein
MLRLPCVCPFVIRFPGRRGWTSGAVLPLRLLANGWNSQSRYYAPSTISYRSTRNPWGGSSVWSRLTEHRILLKAIQLYLHSKVNLNLTAAGESNFYRRMKLLRLVTGAATTMTPDDEGNDGRTVVGILQQRQVHKIIRTLRVTTGTNSVSYGEPVAAFVELRLRIMMWHLELKSRKKTFRVFNFRSTRHTIDAFETTFDWYMSELRKLRIARDSCTNSSR